MKENERNKREWVKTAAIIFLSIMLALTFFSQTIMNYSLPEVAIQYSQSGTITNKIRGTGSIESGDPYEINVTVSKKVSSVAVHSGDKVQKGDVLCYLEGDDSAELTAAKDALEQAQRAYDNAVLTADIYNTDITSAKNDFSAEAYRKQITQAQAKYLELENKRAEIEVALKQLQTAIDDCDRQLAYESTMDVQAADRVTACKEALKQKDAAKTLAQTNRDQTLSDKNAAQAAKDAKQTELEAKQGELDAANAADPKDEELIAALTTEVTALTAQLQEKNAALTEAANKYNAAETELTSAVNAYNQAVKEDENAEAVLAARNSSVTKVNLSSAKAAYELNLYGTQKNLTSAETECAKAKEDLDKLVGKISNISNLEKLLEDIEKAQKAVRDLETDSTGSQITADIAGTIYQVNVTAGQRTQPGTPVFMIQPEGKGCTLSFSVTNAQAKMLSIGDRADLVNAWRYDDVTAVIASIKPDRSDPGQKKLVTFDVSGDVVAGQTLNLSVGQRSANYDCIVPNSAIREDNNGKFVLIVESKSSPLGNRYIATRADVEVLASDDTQSAVSGALQGYEYVITTSNKPVEAGKQVRLADN